MDLRTQNCLVFAARYAHDRNTGAAMQVVNSILMNWDSLSENVKRTIQEEAEHAPYNREDWQKLIDKEI